MAVNIWEGEKVDALIGAISNNQKVDKYQGVNNSGKTLVVGADGLVTVDNVGLTDAAKIALVNCFLHIGFLDDKGPDLIADLQNALFTGGADSRIVYEISHGTDISDWSIDTQQHAFTLDEDFTFLAKVTSNTAGADTTGMFLLDSLSQATPQVGARIQANISDGKISFRSIFNGGNTTGSSGGGAGWGTSGDYSADEVHNVIFVLRNNNKNLTVRTYVDGVLDYQDDTVCGDRSTTYPETYWIGKVRSGAESPWLGTVDMYRIYNVALSDSEIERLLNITM